MSLPTVDECKAYLRVQTDAEDTLLASLLATATAEVEAFVRRPLESATMTFDDLSPRTDDRGRTVLLLPVFPADPNSLTLLDADAVDVEAEAFSLASGRGVLTSATGTVFSAGPYTITADVGLAHADRYEEVILPMLRGAILDLVADAYQRRNPNASSESSGVGVSVAYRADGIPPRVAARLAPYRLPRVG